VNVSEEIIFLKKRIAELEKQLDNLRLSRRVLMDLLEQTEKEKNILSSQLQKKNKSLSKYRKLNFTKLYKNDFEVYEIKDYIKE
jgi:regulator of replication initiation timing